ncbi:MAG: metallophosphoesterase [Candidatus Micrarchaeota archaeon]|nr:metallophosphoesterase [Candidatus Micrarchaeota archaeon]
MLALCVADAHGKEGALAALGKFLEKKPELVLFAGDATHGGRPPGFLEKFFQTMRSSGAHVIAVHGNMDSPEAVAWMEKSGLDLHGRKTEWRGIQFTGLGGGPKSFLNTPGEHAEEELGKALAGIIGPETIVLSHAPPFGTKADDIGNGLHIGSTALRKAIEEIQPRAVVCGHAHETTGTEFIGKTLVVKVPALQDGKAVFLELPGLKTTFV